jgi:hypothetical protein
MRKLEKNNQKKITRLKMVKRLCGVLKKLKIRQKVKNYDI